MTFLWQGRLSKHPKQKGYLRKWNNKRWRNGYRFFSNAVVYAIMIRRRWLIRLHADRCFLWLTSSMSLNAAMAAPSGHFLVSRKKLSVIAQTHLISVSIKYFTWRFASGKAEAAGHEPYNCERYADGADYIEKPVYLFAEKSENGRRGAGIY